MEKYEKKMEEEKKRVEQKKNEDEFKNIKDFYKFNHKNGKLNEFILKMGQG